MFGINKNGTKHKFGIVMPSFFPSSRVTYGSGSVKDALDNRIPITDSSDGGVVFTVSRILVQKYSDSVIRVIFYDDDTTHTYKNAICYFQSTTFTPR